MSKDLSLLIHQIPKVLLHVHLEGTLEPNLMMKFSKKNDTEIPFKNEKEIQKEFEKLKNLNDFLDLYYQGTKVLCTKQDFYDLTFEYLKKCHKNNVRHIEPFFDAQSHTSRGIKFEYVVNGIYDALIDGEKQFKITFRLIMCILRDKSLEEGLLTLNESIKHKDKIFGIGLDSDEINHPPSKFKKLFNEAKKEGFKIFAHGGHDGDPVPYVSELLDLNLDRIDHGVTSVFDSNVLKEIVDRKIPLTVCPISNVKIGPFDDMKHHPINILYKAGAKVTINSDDPAYLLSDICENFESVVSVFNWKKRDILNVVINSIEVSFMTNEEKKSIIQEVNSFL
eukprot:gene8346-171_t